MEGGEVALLFMLLCDVKVSLKFFFFFFFLKMIFIMVCKRCKIVFCMQLLSILSLQTN